MTLSAYFLHIHADQDEYEDEDSYEYINDDVENEEAVAKTGGGRLVGARTSKENEVPFIVGVDMTGSRKSPTCTGSLIAPKWVIIAPHCSPALLHENRTTGKRHKDLEKCLTSGTGRNDGQTFNCRTLEDGSMEFSNIKPEPILWVGLTSSRELDAGEEIKVKRFIRPKKALWRYGGYDIALLEMKGATKQPPACLPSPNFNDNVQSKVAGYGKFLRDNGTTCQTDEQGLMKYHYCENKGTGKHVCEQKPPPQGKHCKKFFKKKSSLRKWIEGKQYSNTHSGENMTPEISLVGSNGKVIATCYVITATNKKHGWCKTKGNYYNLDKPKSETKGWGFCSKDCYLEDRVKEEGGSGTLRVVDKVDVLEDDMCNKYMKRSKLEQYGPEMLCVGYIKKFQTETYTMDGKPYKGKVRHFGDYHNKGFYITNGGVCNGDSGGPLYIQQSKNKFIVTGVSSGSFGILGKCGGINNPSLYARIKKFTKWIATHIGSVKELCWDQDFENK